LAKIYKVSAYLIDYNDEYYDKFELSEKLEDLCVGLDCLEIQESENFEWDDELLINKIDAEKEDFEVYFK